MRYRKKAVEVEAWQVGSKEPMPEWIANAEYDGAGCRVSFYNGTFEDVIVGDWCVLDDYKPIVLAPHFFEQTYEVAPCGEAGLAIARVMRDIAENEPAYLLPADMEDGKLILHSDCGVPDAIICDGKTYEVMR